MGTLGIRVRKTGRLMTALLVPGALWLATPLGVVGCSSEPSSQKEATGTVSLALNGTSSSGTLYRLRNAVVDLSGTSTASVSTEDHLDESLISLELLAGAYLAELEPEWALEKQLADGTFETVRAILTSPNPQGFTVVDQAVTDVVLNFRAGDDIVAFGNGRVHLSVNVDDGPGGGGGGDCEAVCAEVPCGDVDQCVAICGGPLDLVPPQCADLFQQYQACAAGVPAEEYLCIETVGVAGPCMPLIDELSSCIQMPGPTEVCGDGIDNDLDGLIDDEDPDCAPPEVCGDGIDNDLDGLIDEECAPPSWTCNPAYFGVADGCDCGCGAPDPDCSGPESAACDFCDDTGSCAQDCSQIDPNDNASCF
jgi:hypothetical protein